MIEKTGLLVSTTDKLRLRPTTEWTLELFKTESKFGNQERIRCLTASDACYHGAHTSNVAMPPPISAVAATTTPPSTTPSTPAQHVSAEAAASITVGPMGSPSIATTTLRLFSTKLLGTATMPLLSTCQAAIIPSLPVALGAFLLLPTDVAGSLHQASQIIV